MLDKRKQGFSGQIMILMPEDEIQKIEENPLINDLYITDIGYYPSAKYHYRRRESGAEEHILFYALEGKGIIEVQGKSHTVTKDNFFIIPAKTPHIYSADLEDPWTIYWIHFKGSKSFLFDSVFNKVVSISNSHVSRIDERIELFNDIIANLSTGYNRNNIEYANLCLSHLLASFCYLNEFNTVKSRKDVDIVQNIISFMHNNLDKNYMLNDFAKEFKLSISHFSKIFKRRTCSSPINYFIHLKLVRACQLLDFSQMRISEISREIGYDDPFYFSRIFKKTMKISPKAYRARKNLS